MNNNIIKDFKAWLTFEPALTNKDIQNYDFTKLFLPEMKIKYIKSIKSKKEKKAIIKELKNIKNWRDLK